MVDQVLTQAMKAEAGAYADVLYPDEVARCIGYRVQDCLQAQQRAVALSIVNAIIEHGKSEGLVMTDQRNSRGHLIAQRSAPSSANVDAVSKLRRIECIIAAAETLRAAPAFDLDYDLLDPIRKVLG